MEDAIFYFDERRALSRLQKVELSTGHRILIKRDDLIHPVLGGNKYRKLKFNLLFALKEGYTTIYSSGGAFSNHLTALAGLAQLSGFKLRAFVRAHVLSDDNPSFMDWQSYGAEVIKVNPRMPDDEVQKLAMEDGAYFVPMGGSNDLALIGIGEMINEIVDECLPDEIYLAVGSAGCLAGILRSKYQGRIIGISDFSQLEINERLHRLGLESSQYKLIGNEGLGFGQVDEGLLDYIYQFHSNYGILLDPIYTGKAFRTLEEKVLINDSDLDSKRVFIHTGGLPGWKGALYRYKELINRHPIQSILLQ